eukprot:CAMPEP_0173132018 /NCGR_PEP_ID=MMETSP1102-20130122/60992_1 /TAXON_ID=49646 /ORGANISM="Geminigera sp., Strain Caron Lab Isolate" /LENGTH=104 /DNA_ID=CAMNT_0014043457 /DNA_START=1154 /DNA_END=1468 /DNA_ORIENTATION=+
MYLTRDGTMRGLLTILPSVMCRRGNSGVTSLVSSKRGCPVAFMCCGALRHLGHSAITLACRERAIRSVSLMGSVRVAWWVVLGRVAVGRVAVERVAVSVYCLDV